MRKYYTVSYFDTLAGGAGLVRVPVDTLHSWLDQHPGFLIRSLQLI